MTTAQAAASDREIEILGKPYVLAKFTGREWGVFDSWMAGQILQRTRGAVAELQDPEPFISAAVALAARIDSRMCADPAVREVITALWNSTDGQAMHASLLLRKSFPVLSRGQLALLLEDPEWASAYYAATADYLAVPSKKKDAELPVSPVVPATSTVP